jgi:CelD/BcsL family acetyltransferase involved in cellulose biosynthesis
MDVTVHRGTLEPLLDEWSELFAADERATPFQSDAWTRAWDRHWSGGADPWAIVVREGADLAGILPLWSQRMFGLRLLKTSGDPGDYADLVARPDARQQVEDAVAAELARRRDCWDVLVLSELPPDSSTPAAFTRAGLRGVHRAGTVCCGLELPSTFDEFLRRLPSRRRTNLKRYMRKLDRGELELREPGIDELPAAIQRWQALRVRQWQAMHKRLLPAQATRAFRSLVLDAVTDLIPRGLAVMWEFMRAGEVVGSFVNFCDERAFYQYLGAFAPECGSLGIGKIAIGEGIRSSIAAGRTYYDFTRGDETYKRWYGAAPRFSPSLVFASGSQRSAVAARYGALRGPLSIAGGRARALQDRLQLAGRR